MNIVKHIVVLMLAALLAEAQPMPPQARPTAAAKRTPPAPMPATWQTNITVGWTLPPEPTNCYIEVYVATNGLNSFEAEDSVSTNDTNWTGTFQMPGAVFIKIAVCPGEQS